MRNAYKILVGKLKRKSHLGNLHAKGWTKLKCLRTRSSGWLRWRRYWIAVLHKRH